MRTIGPFEIHEPLVRGGHAVVHVARWSGATDDRLVAKVAAVGSELALHDENQALRAVEHPNVIAPVGFVDDTRSVVLVLPRAACSLSAHVGRLDERQVAPVLVQLASALAELHRAGITHGDVRPPNVLFTSDGAPLLADLGRSSAVSPSGAARDVAGLAQVGIEALADAGPLRELLGDVVAEPCDALALGECIDALGIEPRPIDVTAVPAVAVEPPTMIVDVG
jgi:serine/threonine protein kinase